MVDLKHLPKITHKKKKRKGQGYGSGKGKSAGRGTKGQKAREKIPEAIGEAGISYVKRLPLFRGKGRNKRIQKKPLIINLKDLNHLPKKAVVDMEFLISNGLVNQDEAAMFGVKILGDGEIKVPLIIKVRASKSAQKKIEKAGGKVAPIV